VEVRRERDEALVDLEVQLDELWERRTDASEANERIQQLLGVAEQLRKERDEARREVLNAMHPDLRNFYADARGWDFFKETP
jgi:chemotaxis methyl-accepting protein methylase